MTNLFRETYTYNALMKRERENRVKIYIQHISNNSIHLRENISDNLMTNEPIDNCDEGEAKVER